MTFTTNRWVRGEAFFGREALLTELKNRRDRATWVLGNRRVGKTSLLRHIEWICDTGGWKNTLGLYWDFQGSGSSEGLKESFLECLEDKPSLLEKLEVNTDEWEDLSFQEITSRFRRRLKKMRPQRVLLLIDEVEELVDICRAEPQVLGALRKLQDATGFFTMFLAGSLRLLDLDESHARTSPFLPDFLPPVLLGPLGPGASATLLARGGIQGDQAAKIFDLTFGNPHLMQCFAERYLRFGDFQKVMADLKRQKVLDYYFQSVFFCLPRDLREWWADQRCVEELRRLRPGDANLPYVVQASLLRLAESSAIEVNPLLVFLEGHREKDEDRSRQSASTPAAVDRPPYAELARTLQDRADTLTVLPDETFDGDFAHLAVAENPPGLDMLFSSGESTEELLRIVDRASPEYILGSQADERTTVYLIGLFLFHRTFGRAPFAEIEDTWTRAEYLSEKDPPLVQDGHQLGARLAMVLLRAMSPKPENRYQTVDTLVADLDAVYGTQT